MRFLDKIRSQPVETRRRYAFVFMAIVGVIGIIIWAISDFGLSSTGGLSSVKEGADDVAELIQDQTEQFAEDRADLEDTLNQVLKSSALIFPEGLIEENEEPDGVLFLNHEYRERNVAVTLKQVEFYRSASAAVFEIVLEREDPVFIDAALGSVLAQNIDIIKSRITYQPLFQTGSPAQLNPGQPLEIIILFGPLNGRYPFDIILGDFMTEPEPATADRWSAHFSVDPTKVLEQSSTE